MKSGIARIEVQHAFCSECSGTIRTELQKIENISNVYLYAVDSLVVFNFIRANELAIALNTLTALGYPPKGDKIDSRDYVRPCCGCSPDWRAGYMEISEIAGHQYLP